LFGDSQLARDRSSQAAWFIKRNVQRTWRDATWSCGDDWWLHLL